MGYRDSGLIALVLAVLGNLIENYIMHTMLQSPEHVLSDHRWHPVVPAGEVWGMKKSDYRPVHLWVGKEAVESCFHKQRAFTEEGSVEVEFHRYKDSWNFDGFDKTFEGEIVTDRESIPVTIWFTELGFGIKAIEKPVNAQFNEIQLRLRITA